jgi:AraC-like DNA-binding protein
MSQLLNLHGTVGQLAKTTPDILSFPAVARALEQELILVMVRCLTEGDSSEMTAGDRRHDMIIARFEEFLESHPDRPLYLAEICAAIGVAERTLRVVCEEHLGMAPIRFLSMRRMHLVHRALRQADPSKTTVTRIATDHGFWELGRFSVAYRVLFDESPSESLRRPYDGHRQPSSASLMKPPERSEFRSAASWRLRANAVPVRTLVATSSRDAGLALHPSLRSGKSRMSATYSNQTAD